MRRIYRNTVIKHINQIYIDRTGSPLEGLNKVLTTLDFDYYGVMAGRFIAGNEGVTQLNPGLIELTLQEFIEKSPEYVSFWAEIVIRTKNQGRIEDIDYSFNDLLNNKSDEEQRQ